MKFSRFVTTCFSIVLLVLIAGCASLGGGQVSGINWALAKNGGKVSAFSEESEHPASTLINGITDSTKWDEGEGWEAQISISTEIRRTSRSQRDEEERYWVVIELSQPVTVSYVKINTVDSEKYPAKDFGIKDFLVQYELQTVTKELMWANVRRPGKRIGDQDNVIRNNTSGVIAVRFEPVNTRKIRLLIFDTNDSAKAEGGKAREKEGKIRLTEIGVYGTGKMKERDQLETLFEK